MRKFEDILKLHNLRTDNDEILINIHSRTYVNGEPIFITPEQLYNLAQYFDRLFETVPQSYVKLHFGELNDANCDFTKVLKLITSNKLRELNIITESELPLSYFQSIAEACKERKIIFSLTLYHRNSHNDLDCYEKVTALKKAYGDSPYFNMHITYIVSSTELPDDDTKEFIQKTIADGFDVRINLGRSVRIKDVPEDVIAWKDAQMAAFKAKTKIDNLYELTYTDGTKETFQTIYDVRYNLEDNLHTEGYYCSAGITQLCVLPNGDIRRNCCPYLDMFKPLGNIFSNTAIKLPEKYVKCGLEPNEICPFSGRINFLKKRPN